MNRRSTFWYWISREDNRHGIGTGSAMRLRSKRCLHGAESCLIRLDGNMHLGALLRAAACISATLRCKRGVGSNAGLRYRHEMNLVGVSRTCVQAEWNRDCKRLCSTYVLRGLFSMFA